jgi:hypothetical protein
VEASAMRSVVPTMPSTSGVMGEGRLTAVRLG